MRTLAIAAAATLTLAGCATGPTAREGSPPVRHVAISRLPEQPAHDDDRPLEQPPGPTDPNEPNAPGAVAAALVRAGLAGEGLQVVDLGVEPLAAGPAAATVRVAATHRTELAGTPHTSVYQLDLVRDPGRPWRLASFLQVQ